jgi:RNA polymerase-interacting CarD/CdnL/TRCF family regulator
MSEFAVSRGELRKDQFELVGQSQVVHRLQQAAQRRELSDDEKQVLQNAKASIEKLTQKRQQT